MARAGTAAAIAWMLLAAAGLNAGAQDRAVEIKLKAAVVSKLPQFVRWPPAGVGRPLGVCVPKADPSASLLEQLVAGQVLDGRPLTVPRIEREQDVDGCQVLFLSSSAAAGRPSLLERARSLPILTIGDDERFLERGGIVRLRLVGGRIRFDVNLAAAQRVGLQISSELLQLALTVQGGHP